MTLALIFSMFQDFLTRYNEALYGTARIPLPPSQTQAAPYLKVLCAAVPCRELPPPYEDGSPVKLWRIQFIFGSDADRLQSGEPCNPLEDWTALLDLNTWDLPGVMQHGLSLTPENVQERDNRLKQIYSREYRAWVYSRSYNVVDSRWSGRLHICGWNHKPLGGLPNSTSFSE